MQLFEHQKKVLEQTKDLNKVAYYLDMGLGKTYVGSEKALSLGKNILVICQKSKINDWKKHFINEYENKKIITCDLTLKSEFEAFMNMQDNKEYIMIGIINYELFWRRESLLKLKNYTLMLDESSEIQNEKTKRCKFIFKMNFENIILLSGTPTSGKYEKLWSQCNLLGWNIKKTTYDKQYTNWKKLETDFGIVRIVDKQDPYKNVERLKRKLREHGAIFMKTEEVFELPKTNFIEVKCGNTHDYDDFKKDRIIEINNKELVGDTTLNYMLYLRQLATMYNPNKYQTCKDIIESTDSRIIIFYNFKEELKHLKGLTDKPTSEINGDVKDLTNFENEENAVTFVQYQAGSKGLNLQKANIIVYFSPTLSVENFMQSQKRIHRIGQEKPCFYYKLITDFSIENDIYQALERGVNYTDNLFKENFENEQ